MLIFNNDANKASLPLQLIFKCKNYQVSKHCIKSAHCIAKLYVGVVLFLDHADVK